MINLCKCCFLLEDKSENVPQNWQNEEKEEIIVQEEPNRKLSDHFEEDSGTCVDHSNSSAENMLDNKMDNVQLTVSSVNSILPDLDEEEEIKQPLLLDKKTIPMVVLAASKRQNMNSIDKPSALKKPKPIYSRQCSAPSTSSTLITPPVSEASSRRDRCFFNKP